MKHHKNQIHFTKYELLAIGMGTGTFVGIILSTFTKSWMLIPIFLCLGGIIVVFTEDFRTQ